MKKILIVFVFFISCKKISQEHHIKNDTTYVYNIDDYIKLKNKSPHNIKIIDTNCINQTELAQTDFKNGKVTFYYFPKMYEQFRQEKQIKKILENYKMSFEFGFSSCVVLSKDFSDNCYELEMTKKIDEKYGPEFRNTIIKKSVLQYINENPNVNFDFEEVDTIARYPNSKNYSSSLSNPSDDFNKEFKYPKNYNFKKIEYYSITSAEFIILKNGNIKNLTVESNFEDSKNNRFKSHFEKSVSNFIRQTNWIAASIHGVKVNSKMRVIIEHNKNGL